jgi:hypothetical protein
LELCPALPAAALLLFPPMAAGWLGSVVVLDEQASTRSAQLNARNDKALLAAFRRIALSMGDGRRGTSAESRAHHAVGAREAELCFFTATSLRRRSPLATGDNFHRPDRAGSPLAEWAANGALVPNWRAKPARSPGNTALEG